MKNLNISFIWIFIFVAGFFTPAQAGVRADTTRFDRFVRDFEKEFRDARSDFATSIFRKRSELSEVNEEIKHFAARSDYKKLVFALERKMRLQEELAAEEQAQGLQLAKLRYKKGLELTRLLYEKILGLDHHFSSLQAFHNVFSMTNPNAYPGFQQTKSLMEQKLNKKNAFSLPNLLQSNAYISAAYSLMTAFLGDGSPSEKEKNMDNISCILDFTLQMSTDLNTIYYETEFLKAGNNELKNEIATLFTEYARVIGYETQLDRCRKTDDWDRLYDMLDAFIRDLETKSAKKDPIYDQMVFKQHVNLEFSVDRFLQFLDKYNGFIAQGEKYYQKFMVIMNNYENQEICAKEIPYQFSSLKKDIELSISKFNEAYDIAELRGSKLKDLLYGIGD
ncbi:MAG TPA: hypothetical protein PKC40_06410 [Saprospiraceae bacterium]|nr:hypothetical protein [Saprospiraceae bacterium]